MTRDTLEPSIMIELTMNDYNRYRIVMINMRDMRPDIVARQHSILCSHGVEEKEESLLAIHFSQ